MPFCIFSYDESCLSRKKYQVQNGQAAEPKSADILGSFLPQAAPPQIPSQQGFPTSTGSLSIVPQPSKGKFEPKSTVWADTLNRGLVDLNISGREFILPRILTYM